MDLDHGLAWIKAINVRKNARQFPAVASIQHLADYRSLKGIVLSLISMHGAWLSFSDAPLLDNAELHIEDNERVCWWAAMVQANRR